MSGRFSPFLSCAYERGRCRIVSLLIAFVCSLLLHWVAFLLADLALRGSYVAFGPQPLLATFAVGGQSSGAAISKVPNIAQAPQVSPLDRIKDGEVSHAVDQTEHAEVSHAVDKTEHAEAESSIETDAPESEFFETRLLSERPKALNEVAIDESLLVEDGAFGIIVLTLWISKTGDVVSIDVVSSDYSEPSTEVIREGFKNLRFSPGLIDGKPVNTTMKIEVTYDYVFEKLPKPD